jgi:hypothetical protein
MKVRRLAGNPEQGVLMSQDFDPQVASFDPSWQN